jgi:colanic acid biosynthesis protein WcaH
MFIPAEEYNKIKKIFPLPCVDLIVKNERQEILLVKRKNEPAKGVWWFPGGRVMFGEYRNEAAIRKLKEECGIEAENPMEWKTFDVFLQDNEEHYNSHAISTFFMFDVLHSQVLLDGQNSEYAWKSSKEWSGVISSKFMKKIFEELA